MSEITRHASSGSKSHGCLKKVFLALLMLLLSIVSLWAVGAIYFDGPAGRGMGNTALAAGWGIVTVLLLFRFARGAGSLLLTWIACFAVVVIPWLLIPASNDRDWQAEWAKTGWAEINGDSVTFHNFRRFDYTREGGVTERWETKTVRLSNLRGVDYFHDAFGGEYFAHPMLSYDFGVDGRILLSIETRREKGESYSELGGLYKMFELQYLFGDERDFVRVRTNIRKEPVYLYRMNAPLEEIRDTFLDSVHAMNALKAEPQYYNVITHNCTTSYWAQTPLSRREKFDIRVLLNGKLDELMYERGSLVTENLSFAELREKALINPAAQEAHEAPDYSNRIRRDRPGFHLSAE